MSFNIFEEDGINSLEKNRKRLNVGELMLKNTLLYLRTQKQISLMNFCTGLHNLQYFINYYSDMVRPSLRRNSFRLAPNKIPKLCITGSFLVKPTGKRRTPLAKC